MRIVGLQRWITRGISSGGSTACAAKTMWAGQDSHATDTHGRTVSISLPLNTQDDNRKEEQLPQQKGEICSSSNFLRESS
jgi:hypothetical protein